MDKEKDKTPPPPPPPPPEPEPSTERDLNRIDPKVDRPIPPLPKDD